MWPELRPNCMPSFILIHPTSWPQYINVTNRTNRQTRSNLWPLRTICDFISLVLNMTCVSFILLTGLLTIGIVCWIELLQLIILNYFKKTWSALATSGYSAGTRKRMTRKQSSPLLWRSSNGRNHHAPHCTPLVRVVHVYPCLGTCVIIYLYYYTIKLKLTTQRVHPGLVPEPFQGLPSTISFYT